MNKEALIVMIDCNSTMGKIFASKNEDDAQMNEGAQSHLNDEAQTRF